MIAEWFYPKELKDIIADLRAKGDLNGVAVDRINILLYRQLFLFFVGFVFIAYVGSLILLFLFPFVFFAYIYLDFFKYISHKILPYCKGTKKDLRLVKRVPYRFGVVLQLSEDQTGRTYKTPLLFELQRISGYRVGEVQSFFVQDISGQCMPDSEPFLNKYSVAKPRV